MSPTPSPINVIVSNGGWDLPTVSTLIVSVLALLAAVGSIVFARRMAQNDDARRYVERTPKLDAGVEAVGNPARYQLWLELDPGSEPLTGLTIELPNDVPWKFAAGQEGTPAQESSKLAHRVTKLERGARDLWWIDLANGTSSTARVRFICQRDGVSWLVVQDVKAKRRATISAPSPGRQIERGYWGGN